MKTYEHVKCDVNVRIKIKKILVKTRELNGKVHNGSE